MNDLKIIAVKSGEGAKTAGTENAIDALTEFVSYKKHVLNKLPIELVDPKPTNGNMQFSHATAINSVYKTCCFLSALVQKTLRSHQSQLIIGGDHSLSIGTISGIKCAYPALTVGVIWIDAHADIHSPYTSPSGSVHGMPLAALLSADNLGRKRNVVAQNVRKYWNQLKSLGGISPKLNYSDVVFVGLRDMETAEQDLINEHSMQVYSVENVVRNGPVKTAKQILNTLRHCDIINISFDVDSLDPEVIPGTGTKVASGFSELTIEKLIKSLLGDVRVRSLEVVEINPNLDVDQRSIRTIINMLSNLYPS